LLSLLAAAPHRLRGLCGLWCPAQQRAEHTQDHQDQATDGGQRLGQ
jgi:hypothetical protein